MTKSIIAERQLRESESQAYDKQVKKFLGEFGIKDSPLISSARHNELMEDHFYWIDLEENQGYHIHDDIEYTKRVLTKEEGEIYEHLYYDASAY